MTVAVRIWFPCFRQNERGDCAMAEHQRTNSAEGVAQTPPNWPRMHHAGKLAKAEAWLHPRSENSVIACQLLADIHELLDRSQALVAETRRLAEESQQVTRENLPRRSVGHGMPGVADD